MNSTSSFSQRDLYGGAMSANIPKDYIDASDLRQIPDHQEVFLSKATLTSIIFEINVYQLPSAVDVHSNIRRASTSQADDEGASTHHFLDPIAAPDHLDPDAGDLTPERVAMQSQSLSKFPAYKQTGTIISPELDRTTRSILPLEWAQNPPKKATETKCYQLLMRLRPYGTDMCVRINVPLKEFGEEQDSVRTDEIAFAEQILQNIISSLDVKSFDLFAGDD